MSDIRSWIDQGELCGSSMPLPNVILTPLTIIMQIVEYFCFLEKYSTTHSQVLKKLESAGVQGFCTGSLTAVALACSRHEDDVNAFGAVALHLAMFIGAIVDLDGASAGPSNETTCLAIRWKREDNKDGILKYLEDHRDARFFWFFCRTISLTFPRLIFRL